MNTINPSLKLYLNLSKILTETTRRFSGGLDGMGWSEFVILFHLNQEPEKRMRRVDLAEKLGLTPSGVTRLLAPMEKIGLVKREAALRDARVSYTTLTRSGHRNLNETLKKAECFAEEIFPSSKFNQLSELSKLLIELGGTVK